MPFQPGQSGNPGGRPRNDPKRLEFKQRCLLFMNREGWDMLEEVARERHGRDRLRALETIAAYAVGRPTQPISGDVDPEAPPIQVTVTFDKPEAAAD